MRNKTRTKFGVSITEAGIRARKSVDYFTGETITFDSILEKKFYDEVIIKGLEDGKILKYERQVKYVLQPSFKYLGTTIRPIYYVSDFDIYYADGSFMVVDVKGMATADAKIKAKMFKYVYKDICLMWVSKTSNTGWVEYNELNKIRRNKKKGKNE